MQICMIKKTTGIAIVCSLLTAPYAFAKNGGGNGGVGNCNGNGNVKHGCGSSVVTPDILSQTPQGNARQPTAPIPTANQLPPVAPAAPPQLPQVEPRIAVEGTPIPSPLAPALPPPQRTTVETSPAYIPPSINVTSSAAPQMVPMATPPLVPQQVPVRQAVEGTPIEQRVPDLPPPQTTTVVTSAGYTSPTLVVEPPRTPQMVPMATPPLVPPMVPQPKPMSPPLAPPKVPQRVPQMISVDTPLIVTAVPGNPTLPQPNPAPQVEVTLKASSAGYNQNMIANIPGRQPADAYAVFKNDATGAYRECVVSGLEARKVILPNGEVVYRGTLPGFRTVSNELTDIPSWHPHEAGCIISLEHKKKYPVAN